MARLTDADALKKAIMAEPWKNEPNAVRLTVDYINIIIDEQPTVDAVPVVHGRWSIKDVISKKAGYGVRYYYHAECEVAPCRLVECPDGYCPNCGAKMDLEVE